MIRTAIIGCGMIARLRHAPEYSANPESELTGLYDANPERAEALSREFGGRVYTDLDTMLSDPSIDAVSICTANATHAELTVRALEHGKHVLCEKPMATTTADAQKMVDAAARSGKVLMIGHNQRLAPAHKLAKEILESGRLGRVLSFQTTFSHGGPESWLNQPNARNVWFFNSGQSAFGVLGDLAIHKLDLLCWLLDDDVADVKAFTDTLDKHFEDGTPIPVEDNAAVVMRFQSGAIGTLLSSWTAYGAEDNSTVLNCERGILQIYRGDTQLREIAAGGRITDYNPGAIQTNASQTSSGVIDLFLQGVRRGKSPIPGDECLRALRIVERILA